LIILKQDLTGEAKAKYLVSVFNDQYPKKNESNYGLTKLNKLNGNERKKYNIP